MKSLSYRLKRAGLDKSRLNSFAVIGLGRFGASVAVTLERMGFSVIAIDKDENKVEEIKDYVSYAKVLDSTNINALREAGVQNVDVAIVSIAHDIEASVLTSLLVKELGVKFVIARAISEPHEKILDKIGVDLVVYPERDMGVRIAQRLVVPNVIDYMEFYANTKIFELEPPEAVIGKTIQELDLRKNYGLYIIAIQRGSDLIVNISPSEKIQKGDILYIIGGFENLNKFLNKL